MNKKSFAAIAFACTTLLGITMTGCQKKTNNDTTTDTDTAAVVKNTFDADSAWQFCDKQCAFGPRTMNSEAHEQCKQWIIAKFQQYGCETIEQKADLKGYDGTILKSTNIIARTKGDPDKPRIIICAHWDSRPWADNDPDSTNWRKPVMAANDGASGVAVMLELARIIQADTTLQVGVDFICFDAEDWGTPQWLNRTEDESWALGSKYWAQNETYPKQFAAQYGILLDMVGGENARFYQEGVSRYYAQHIIDKVWNAARIAGFSDYFPNEEGGTINDDHLPMNQFAKIPTIDIIPFYADNKQSSFGSTWHTISDDMKHIDKNTLKAVGQTLLQLLYTE